MKKYILLGLIVLGASTIASDVKVVNENNSSEIDSNQTKEPKQEKKKVVIDLDKEKKESGLKGDDFKMICGFVKLGHNDEVSFKGKKLFLATPIQLFINGKLYATIRKPKDIFTLKTSILKVGDIITIKNRFVTLVKKKVIK